ncbi:hypothetical protein VP01_13449g1, partial [Puccinia sorghi]
SDVFNLYFFLFQDHSSTYPVLASLAKDFLESSASSCAVERTFSSAANVSPGDHFWHLHGKCHCRGFP